MEFFESLRAELTAVAALLLFLPFFALKNQQKPSRLRVGGLDPFQAVSAQGHDRQKKRPPSFWMFLFAYLLAAGCLFAAQLGSPRTLILVDQSPSAVRAGIVPSKDEANTRVVGGPEESILASDLLEELRGIPAHANLTVLTDLEQPESLPAWIKWSNPNSKGKAEVLGVLLHAQPVDANHWRVHWALQENVTASLQCGDWQSKNLLGVAGSMVVPVSGLADQILLRVDGVLLGPEIAGASVALAKVDIQLPEHAHQAWDAVARASWPSANLSKGSGQSLVVDGGAIDLSPLWEELPWQREPHPEELARFAKGVRDAIQTQHPPRDVREFLPQPQASAVGYNFPSPKDSASGQIPEWIPLAGFFAWALAAFAWFRIPREGNRVYSEV